ncbi:MAG: leucyl/phenylalanyl-tRNA--protein transferase [Helicobacteraceae bacterium 4484_230]|nr:MAG: leucyl/phenylalanyl-tRNA--protein transferase [Helicobacteraceae bacterium 4484_230]
MITALRRHQLDFPNPREAGEDGLLAYGGDLSPSRLIRAYRSGIFPWYSKGDPILWWSPAPRLILNLDDFKLRRSLKKRIKQFEYRIDSAFTKVMGHCAETPRPGQSGSWILPEIIEAYEVLHGMGIAHSFETYKDGRLVGGLYGVAIGRVFCGESMFAHENDASKAAFAVLIRHLKAWGFDFIDAQIPTEHLKSLGAIEVDREYFLMRLDNVKDEDVNADAWKLNEELIG